MHTRVRSSARHIACYATVTATTVATVWWRLSACRKSHSSSRARAFARTTRGTWTDEERKYVEEVTCEFFDAIHETWRKHQFRTMPDIREGDVVYYALRDWRSNPSTDGGQSTETGTGRSCTVGVARGCLRTCRRRPVWRAHWITRRSCAGSATTLILRGWRTVSRKRISKDAGTSIREITDTI